MSETAIILFGEEEIRRRVQQLGEAITRDYADRALVLITEDIIDTGLTLSYLMSALRARNPASLEVCTLLDKSARRIAPLEIRYRGFECPDQFVVGYGLDHQERYRNLPFILAMGDPSVAPGAVDAYLSGLVSESGASP